ncbi:MAG: hypothetical protein RIF37_02795 [Rhodospirillaceae bacterium]
MPGKIISKKEGLEDMLKSKVRTSMKIAGFLDGTVKQVSNKNTVAAPRLAAE